MGRYHEDCRKREVNVAEGIVELEHFVRISGGGPRWRTRCDDRVMLCLVSPYADVSHQVWVGKELVVLEFRHTWAAIDVQLVDDYGLDWKAETNRNSALSPSENERLRDCCHDVCRYTF